VLSAARLFLCSKEDDKMISILCPCYDEEAVLDLFFEKISEVTAKIPEKFEFE